jgi:hypothetical protein
MLAQGQILGLLTFVGVLLVRFVKLRGTVAVVIVHTVRYR